MQFRRYQIKALLSVLFGILVIWTGLGRGIEARAYKPNALWFCMVVGLLAITVGFLFQLHQIKLAILLGSVVSAVVLFFYLAQFILHAESDANLRVGFVIVAAIAHLVSILFPAYRNECSHH